jgi:hypothetical protein
MARVKKTPGVSRRRFFQGTAAVVTSVVGLKVSAKEKPATESRSEPPRATEAMDAALALLAPTGPEFGGGLSNHGPMACEALVVLDRADAVIPWVERYRRTLDQHPSSRKPIGLEEWREAVGDYRRVGDWIAFFDRRLEGEPWRSVLSDWCGRLAPGISAAAFHGVIRTAHAARSLARREEFVRRRELAEGLAYWASRYHRLPESPRLTPGRSLPSEAIRAVELVPEERRGQGNITDRLRPLEETPAFARVADLVDPGIAASRFLSDLAETFAGTFLAHATNGTTIALVHAVTGPSAIRLLASHVEPGVTRAMLRYGWQAAAAIYATSASSRPDPLSKPGPTSREDLVDQAVRTGDEHAIKFTEACLREHAIAPRPVFLAAALDATKRLSRG